MGTEAAVETAKTGEIKEGEGQEKDVKDAEVTAKEGEKTEEEIEKEKAAAAAKHPEKTAEEKQRDREAFERRKREKEKQRLHDLEIENAELRGFKKALEKGGKTEREDTASTLEAEYSREHPEPKEDDFKTWAEFNKSHTRWAVGLANYEQTKTSGRQDQDAESGKMRSAIAKQREQGEQEFEDFSDIVADLTVSEPMLAAMYASPIGHQLAYYLGQNPKEQERISSLNPYLQAKELGKIESKIESGAILLKKPISKAPEPAPKPGSKGATLDADEKRYADPNTPTKERLEISKRLQARREQGQ